ncbi:glycyl-radical enzyme activating protein [Spirochaeta isovalerica]|uniref:Pyruvate formate lyase activating enzyme n=1 Tax=Spirochaeta isovalerica TaxID=150 RepID=A0A841RAL1_9SPIO|nr:glycyl-radical enzyme activating protein [Spirochaeta isovalerica]MBB6482424.1 pyruvate formate lyase activating enzyme [Spirochaeta isovalerica]
MSEKEIKGLVLEIQRMSTEDGPGLRTTVFLKGCPLRCSWCHNPESISSRPRLQWIGSNCIMCGSCIDVCPYHSLTMTESSIEIDWKSCTACGLCVNECPTNALEILGKKWTSDQLVEELLKDEAFFEESGGGITISGGEAMMQAEFVKEVFQKLKSRGIHTTLDTCGIYQWKKMEEVLPFIDLILFDFKESNPLLHREYTGAEREIILANFKALMELKEKGVGPKELWIRTPAIPGATARTANISGIAGFLRDYQDEIDRWEICAFNNLCKDKYARLGQTWKFADSPLMKKEEMDGLVRTAVEAGFDSGKVLWTGMTAQQEKK